MPDELKTKLKDVDCWGYYDENHEFVLEIFKEDLIKYLKEQLNIKHIRIV